MTHHGDSLGIDGGICFQVIQATAKAPGPTCYGGPIGRLALLRVFGREKWVDSVFVAVVEIRVYVAIINGSKRIASGNDGIDCPTGCSIAATRLVRLVVLGSIAVSNPRGGNTNGGICVGGVVAHEINCEKTRNRTLGLLG